MKTRESKIMKFDDMEISPDLKYYLHVLSDILNGLMLFAWCDQRARIPRLR